MKNRKFLKTLTLVVAGWFLVTIGGTTLLVWVLHDAAIAPAGGSTLSALFVAAIVAWIVTGRS